MEPERRLSVSAAEPGSQIAGVSPERSSPCSLLPLLSEIQTLVERSKIINVSVASLHPPLLAVQLHVALWNSQAKVKLVENYKLSTGQRRISLSVQTFALYYIILYYIIFAL